jgi:hypothetical protein
MKTKDELTERAKGLLRLKGFKGVESEFWMTAISDVMADFAAQETASLTRDLAEARESNRYALAVFRALEQYTFEDSDHGLLIAEAVKKLEAAALTAASASPEPTSRAS